MQAQSLETTDSGPFRRTVTPFVLLLVWAGETKATCLIPLDLSLESQRMCVRFWTHSLLWGCLWDPEVAKSICFEEGAWGSRRVQRLIWLELSLRKPSRQNNPGSMLLWDCSYLFPRDVFRKNCDGTLVTECIFHGYTIIFIFSSLKKKKKQNRTICKTFPVNTLEC